jgi:hypothetical protein
MRSIPSSGVKHNPKGDNMSELAILYDELEEFEELVEITGSERMALEYLMIKELEQLKETT